MKPPRMKSRDYVLTVPLNPEEVQTLNWIRAETQVSKCQAVRDWLRRERRRILEGTQRTTL